MTRRRRGPSPPARQGRRALRRLLLVALLAVGVAPVGPPAAAGGIGARPVATGLAFPAAFTFGRGGRVWYGERLTGEIRILNPKTGQDRLFFTIPDVVAQGEQGLLGLALHPDYPATPHVFAFATREIKGTPRNQILRITGSGGRGTDMRVIFTSSPAAGRIHNGGRILFGPDGMLYAVIGESGNPANSQDLGNTAGKVLRMTPAGRVPQDNPFSESLVFAFGIRNSFGFAFDPQTGRLWETDNGPECNDELNLIRAGGNYGWGPSETCATPPEPPANTNRDGPSPILPKRWYNPVIAPTGAAFCSGCRLGRAAEGRLFFGAYATGEIRKVTLWPKRGGVKAQTVVYEHPEGILSVEVGPGGRLFFSDADAIYRLVRR